MDLSTLSIEDLQALKAGDLSKVSTEGLVALKGASTTKESAPVLPPAETFDTARWAQEHPIEKGLVDIGGKVGQTIGAGIAAIPGAETALHILGVPGGLLRAATAGQPGQTMTPEAHAKYWSGGDEAWNQLSPMQQGIRTLGSGFVDPLLAAGPAISALGRALKPAPSLLTPVGKTTLKEAQAADYVVPPSEVRSSFLTNKMESVAGKASVKQEAIQRNQQVTNRLATKAIGLPEGTPLDEVAIAKAQAPAAAVYAKVGALRPTVDMEWFPRFHNPDLLAEYKQANTNAIAAYRSYESKGMQGYGDPKVLATAKAFRAEAESIESDLLNIAKAAGQPDLMNEFQQAKKLFAKTFDVERALNKGSGNVSAPMIGRMLKQDRPLSGELKVIGKFAQGFKKFAGEVESSPIPHVSGTDAASAAILATMGYGAGGPAGLLAAGLPLLRSPARAAVLSKRFQQGLLKAPAPVRRSKGPLVSKIVKTGLVGRVVLPNQPSP